VAGSKLLASAANVRRCALNSGAAGAEFDALSDAAIFEAQRGGVQLGSDARKAEGRVGFHVHMRRLQSVGAQSFRSGFAFLVCLRFSFPLFPGIAQAMRDPQDFPVAFGGIAKSSSGRDEISGLQSQQAEIKRIIILIGSRSVARRSSTCAS